MHCLVCRERPLVRGVACAVCLGRIADDAGLTPEQVVSNAPNRANAWLVDQWGRPHPLQPRTIVGRTGGELAVYRTGISRKHAMILRTADRWSVCDLESRNGTQVDGQDAGDGRPLQEGAMVSFGPTSFLFATGDLPAGSARLGVLGTAPITAVEPEAPRLVPPALRLVEPTRGGGGVLVIDGREVQLTLIQFALLSMLVERAAQEADRPAEVRGFIPSGELLAELPWDAVLPSADNLKKLIRRVRRRLADLPIAIESKRGLGYRLVR